MGAPCVLESEMTCLNCDDRGFTNAFVYCIECLKVAVHRYCLDVVPDTVDEFVQWVCDECDTELQNQLVVQCKTGDSSIYQHVEVLQHYMEGGGEHDLNFEDNNLQHVEQERNIAKEMACRPVVVRHSGHWEKSEYKDGDEQLVYISKEHLCCDYLFREIHDIMQTDPTTADYLLFYTTSMSDGRRIKVALKSDSDLSRLLDEQNDEVVVYVIEKTSVVYSQRSRVPLLMNLSGPSMVVDDNIRHQDPIGDHDLSHEDETTSTDEDEEDSCSTELFESLITEFSGWVREPGRIDTLLSKTDRGVLDLSSDNALGAEGYAVNDIPDMASHIELRNWVIPLAKFDNAVPMAWVESSVATIGTLFVGAIFRKKDDLTIAVGMHHMQNRVDYSVYRSNGKRMQFVCKEGNGCPFKLCAVVRDGIWIVYKFNSNHTCPMDLRRCSPRLGVIAAYFARKLLNGGNILKPKDMMLEIDREFGIQIIYESALRSRNIMIEMIYGEYEKSYQMLPTYLYMLKQRNHRTLYDLQMTNDDRFSHMFLALGPCIDAFKHHLRPVIIVDGIQLKGKNKGVLFIAVTKDGNEQVFPLGVGISLIENDESWVWFLTRLRLAFGQPNDLVIVSDEHESIKKAVEAVFPSAIHGLCYYHLRNKIALYGSHETTIFQNAAYSYRAEEFQKSMSSLEILSKDKAYKRLCSIGAQRWSRSQCPVRRFSFMTSNAAMILNGSLSWARTLPICSLLEVFRNVVEKWFDERRAAAISSDQVVTEEAMAKLSKSVEHGRSLKVHGTTSHLWKVEVDMISFMVDLQQRTCECREFDLDLLPCCHAAAAIENAGLPIYEFVGHYYKQSTLAQIYKSEILPLPHPDEWIVPASASLVTIRAPLIERRARSSRTNGAELGGVSSSNRCKQVCSRCQSSGHNKRACRAYVPNGGVNLNESHEVGQPAMARKRQLKKCSICHETGHTKPKCPTLARENNN